MKRFAVLSIVAAALLAPSAALASGVVIKVQPSTHLVAVARSKTSISLVHTQAKVQVGQRVALTARRLRNGTLAATRMRVVGRAHTVRFRGLLLAKSRTRLVVSAGGAVISVHRGRTTSQAADDGPKPGTTVDVTTTVGKDDDLDEDSVAPVTADHPGGSIEGKVTLGSGKITVVAEHIALVITVPAGVDLTGVQNGDEVLAVFAQQADGTLVLTSLSRDGDEQEADDDSGDDDGGGGHGEGDDGGDDGGGHR